MPQETLVRLLGSLVPEEGVISDIIDGVNLFRITSASPRFPQKYDPCIIILAQGSKRLFIGDEIVTYDALNYLVLTVPLPLECETTASADKPLLGLRIRVDATMIGEILLAMDDEASNPGDMSRGIFSAPVSEQLLQAGVRLLEALSSIRDRRFLGSLIVREIVYRILNGEKGDALRALAYRNQRLFQVSRILDRIHATYGKKLDLPSLAREAGMSISAFHSSFKAVTSTSPLQYIKNIRLHKARFLMLEEGFNANTAAYQVGYESPSQFNREYKRLFGLPPARDTLHS